MHHLKARIFAVLLILVSIGLIYYNWRQLLQEHEYCETRGVCSAVCNWRALSPDISLNGRKAHHHQGKDNRAAGVCDWDGGGIS